MSAALQLPVEAGASPESVRLIADHLRSAMPPGWSVMETGASSIALAHDEWPPVILYVAPDDLPASGDESARAWWLSSIGCHWRRVDCVNSAVEAIEHLGIEI